MSNIVFNNFKKRYLEGKVPSADTWTFIPVSEQFKNDFERNGAKIEQYRTIKDFQESSSGKFFVDGIDENGNYITSNLKFEGDDFLAGKVVDITWKKVLDDDSLSNKPMYITNSNYDAFLEYYGNNIQSNTNIESYLNSGFYYIRSKDELEWFANRADENNTIIGVLGDNIEGVISKPICTDEKIPFEGILDGNYYSLVNVTINAVASDNGIIGILGKNGIVRNFNIKNDIEKNPSATNKIDCKVPITLNYIKSDSRDINCGLLVGRNYGTVENIYSNHFKLDLFGFVPSVYSVTNKTDIIKWNETENFIRKKFDEANENFFYLNSFCINSPGNICPYVGYFAEGKFADDNNAIRTDAQFNVPSIINPNTISSYYENLYEPGKYYIDPHFELSAEHDETSNEFFYSDIGYRPLGYFWGNGFSYHQDPNVATYQITGCRSFEKIENEKYYIKNPLYYGLDNYGYYTVRLIGPLEDVKDNVSLGSNRYTFSSTIECYNSNLIAKTIGTEYDVYLDDDNKTSGTIHNNIAPGFEQTRVSLRMQPNARVAYNVGTIVGANFGNITNIELDVTIKNTSNFVGFIGGLAGKISFGNVYNANVNVDYDLVYDVSGLDDSKSAGYAAFYKQTPIFPNIIKNCLISNYASTIKFRDFVKPFQEWDSKNIIDTFCTPYYDKEYQSDISYNETIKYVNTASTITDDVIEYRLKPIFVVGGLFGRYIPSMEYDKNNNLKLCSATNCFVNYKDNYSNENVISIEKRMENAFGALVGKVDYSTITNSISSNINGIPIQMIVNNCTINAISNVGQPFETYKYTFDESKQLNIPVLSAIENNTTESALVPVTSNKRLVGIYELKENVIDSVAYAVNSEETVSVFNEKDDDTSKLSYDPKNLSGKLFDTTKHSLTSAGIFWASDYPFAYSLSGHNDGIVKTHNHYCYYSLVSGEQQEDNFRLPTNISRYVNYFIAGYFNGYGTNSYWDYLHKHLQNPNLTFSSLDDNNYVPISFNKRNLATTLISLNNSYTNCDSYIQIYDDYLNTWNLGNLPDLNNDIIDSAHIITNHYTQNEINNLTLYWNIYKTNYKIQSCQTYYTLKDLSAIASSIDPNMSVMNSSYYDGLFPRQLNIHLIKGTQNTFDGYTTVDFQCIGSYNVSASVHTFSAKTTIDWLAPPYTYTDEYQYDFADGRHSQEEVFNCFRNSYPHQYDDGISGYYLPRKFKKNIISMDNPVFKNSTNVYEQNLILPTLNNTILPARDDNDLYYYYTYDISNHFNKDKRPTALEQVFAMNYDVVFKNELYSTMDFNMGYAITSLHDYKKNDYSIKLEENRKKYMNDGIYIGEYYQPSAIRKLINESENNEFTMSSISSTNKIGGVLVIDSSANNVMFLETQQPVQLTANSMKFNTYQSYETSQTDMYNYILDVSRGI